MPAKDRRYRVTPLIIESMRRMRLTGASYQKIADTHEVSFGTAYYWINDKYREEKRAINAKRAYAPGDKQRIQRDQQKRKENWRADPEMKLRHTLQSAKDEKRIQRKTVKGMSMKEAEKVLKSGELKRPNRKMD